MGRREDGEQGRELASVILIDTFLIFVFHFLIVLVLLVNSIGGSGGQDVVEFSGRSTTFLERASSCRYRRRLDIGVWGREWRRLSAFGLLRPSRQRREHVDSDVHDEQGPGTDRVTPTACAIRKVPQIWHDGRGKTFISARVPANR